VLPLDDTDGRSDLLPQVSAPLTAVLNARTARGVQAARRGAVAHRCSTQPDVAPVIQFALCRQNEAGTRPPLGWSMSAATRDGIARDVRDLLDPPSRSTTAGSGTGRRCAGCSPCCPAARRQARRRSPFPGA
jgi:hypothetical protein